MMMIARCISNRTACGFEEVLCAGAPLSGCSLNNCVGLMTHQQGAKRGSAWMKRCCLSLLLSEALEQMGTGGEPPSYLEDKQLTGGFQKVASGIWVRRGRFTNNY